MTDSSHVSTPSAQPPPAPPLPPGRGVFQKIIAPLSFNIGARPHITHTNTSAGVSPSTTTSRIHRHLPSQTTAHRTSIPIAAIDINRAKTHAILAGHEILKTVHVHNGRMVEDFNIRTGITSYASSQGVRSEAASHRREYLPAKDVVWSKGERYDHIVATAALNGRIALYDVSRINRSQIELSRIHEHTGQVNKLDFDPTGGYYLLSGSQDKTVRVWDIREPQSVKRKQGFNIRQPVRDVRWSPTDPGEFALCTENGVVQRWDLRKPGGALLSINAHGGACYAIDWHPDGRHLVSGGFDKYAKVWDLKGDRRQRAAFELRAPQAILNVRWRPPCWSSDPAEKGHWQSAQLATSYTDDDPRIHIWDLRRRLLPFREIDSYYARPTDMIWASEDFLWSVGNLGMFTQNDVRYASLVQEELPTSTTDFMPDGTFISFSEDLRSRRISTLADPAAGFLRIPKERLSGGTDGGVSRSLSGDDEEGGEGLLTSAIRQRAHKTLRAKSQGNTPPTGDEFEHIVPLDRSVLNAHESFNNEQAGMVSTISGTSAEPEVVEFLATNYACPLTREQRRENPTETLDELQRAFHQNANACDYVSLHRTAQSWRILSAVVIPELRDWANSNREERLQIDAKHKASYGSLGTSKSTRNAPPNLKLSKAKVMSHVFKGVTDYHGSDPESTSNMTTPTAKPLPDSPFPPKVRDEHESLIPNESIDHIPPLPPSVISSHSTAAAASKALMDSASDDTPISSPERPRRPMSGFQSHKRSITDIPGMSLNSNVQLSSPQPQTTAKQVPKSVVQLSPRMELRKQEDRRAAIRDFRAQQRQLFTLEEPIQSPRSTATQRHDSSESFSMFAASTDSSHRTRSLGRSLDLTSDKSRGYRDSEDWQSISMGKVNDSVSSSSTGLLRGQSHNSQKQYLDDDSIQEDFPMDETSRIDFSLDGVVRSNLKPTRPKPSASATMWDINDLGTSSSLSQSETAASSASGSVFPFEEATTTQKLKIYSSNPIRRIVSKAETSTAVSPELQVNQHTSEDASSRDYVFSDFRPIDLTLYEPKLPFAWSSIPLICHSIAFDINEGVACAQFSIHLLMHMYPFFFSPDPNLKVHPGTMAPDSIAERLMRPDLNQRIIEGLFLNHYLCLKRLGLYRPMAELRNICVDFGFETIFKPSGSDQPVGASLRQDPYLLQNSCSHCYSFLQPGTSVCQNCGTPRAGCPICLQTTLNQQDDHENSSGNVNTPTHLSLWTFCQACGHSAHWSCMQEWMLQLDAEGECPTRDCGCDCGPGVLHQQRIARQRSDAETTEIIRGSRSSGITKKDPLRASHSPAVDKARSTLKSATNARDNGTDERSRRSFSGRGGERGSASGFGTGTSVGAASGAGAGTGPGMSQSSISSSLSSRATGVSQSFGRRVRLVTPSEETAP